MSSWARAIPIGRAEITTVMRDGKAYRETRFGTFQRLPSAPALPCDGLMQACLDQFYGRKPSANLASMEGDEPL